MMSDESCQTSGRADIPPRESPGNEESNAVKADGGHHGSSDYTPATMSQEQRASSNQDKPGPSRAPPPHPVLLRHMQTEHDLSNFEPPSRKRSKNYQLLRSPNVTMKEPLLPHVKTPKNYGREVMPPKIKPTPKRKLKNLWEVDESDKLQYRRRGYSSRFME